MRSVLPGMAGQPLKGLRKRRDLIPCPCTVEQIRKLHDAMQKVKGDIPDRDSRQTQKSLPHLLQCHCLPIFPLPKPRIPEDSDLPRNEIFLTFAAWQ